MVGCSSNKVYVVVERLHSLQIVHWTGLRAFNWAQAKNDYGSERGQCICQFVSNVAASVAIARLKNFLKMIVQTYFTKLKAENIKKITNTAIYVDKITKNPTKLLWKF